MGVLSKTNSADAKEAIVSVSATTQATPGISSHRVLRLLFLLFNQALFGHCLLTHRSRNGWQLVGRAESFFRFKSSGISIAPKHPFPVAQL